jgi:type VI secretion system protein
MKTILAMAPMLAAMLSIVTALAGCASKPPLTTIQTVQVFAAPDANSASGTQLDLVLVFDTNAVAALPATSVDWFAKKPALVAGLAKSIKLVELQLPAGYPATSVPLPAGYTKAIGVYSYASYLTAAGQVQCNLTPFVNVTLRLLNDHVDCAGH